MYMTITHDAIPPVYDAASRVLVLGSLPSPASRREAFYYMHPQNRFWPVLAAVFGEPVPVGRDARRAFALAHGVALWDVIARCDIDGASDSTIRNAEPNDFGPILAAARIERIFCTGKRAWTLYQRLCAPKTGIDAISLPSTSPANMRFSVEALVAAYRQISPSDMIRSFL
jgi:hypoxanthine-DNA glycosylase